MNNTIYIHKSEVNNRTTFEIVVGMHNCMISQENKDYYVIEGKTDDLYSFCNYWKNRKEMIHIV